MCESKVFRFSARCCPAYCPMEMSRFPKVSFGSGMLPLALDNVFGRLRTRKGLTRRDRNLVTQGILIALRATDELQIHLQIA